MIVFFGPAGAGKSVQGQILAARHGWRWLSSGQMLRDSRDAQIMEQMRTGKLVSNEQTYQIISEALERAQDMDRVILDGFPRTLEQAEWLLQELKDDYQRKIQLAIVLEVPRADLEKRLKVRGRVDDTSEVIEERLRIYRKEIYPLLSYLTEQNTRIAHVDGTGSVGQIHDRVELEIRSVGLIENGE